VSCGPSALGAPTRGWWVPVGVAYEILVIAFGVGLWLSADRNRWLHFVGGLLVIYGLFNSYWPRRTRTGSQRHQIIQQVRHVAADVHRLIFTEERGIDATPGHHDQTQNSACSGGFPVSVIDLVQEVVPPTDASHQTQARRRVASQAVRQIAPSGPPPPDSRTPVVVSNADNGGCCPRSAARNARTSRSSAPGRL
jgi:hypothetical protein